MTSSPLSAIVIGAGIAGPAMAMALQKSGITSTVYEAHPAGARGVGAFLTVATNGIDALRTLQADGAVLATGFPTPGIALRSCNGKGLGSAVTGWALADGTQSHTIKRTGLYSALIGEAERRGIGVVYGKRLVSAEDTGTEVRARFSDGTVAAADLLVGCDGVHSAVRQIIDPAAPAPSYAGLVNTSGYTTGVDVSIEPGSYEMIFGRRAFFGYAKAPDGEVWWFANLPRRREPTRSELDAVSQAELRIQLLAAFAGDAGPATALIDATPAIAPMTAIRTIPSLPHWQKGRLVVAGDAAHAPSPTSGQGASLAIEDGLVLARCLRDLDTVPAALAAFEAARRPRAESIIKWAARMNSSKAAGPVGRAVRDSMMPLFMKMAANSKANGRIYRYHIDWDQPATAIAGARP